MMQSRKIECEVARPSNRRETAEMTKRGPELTPGRSSRDFEWCSANGPVANDVLPGRRGRSLPLAPLGRAAKKFATALIAAQHRRAPASRLGRRCQCCEEQRSLIGATASVGRAELVCRHACTGGHLVTRGRIVLSAVRNPADLPGGWQGRNDFGQGVLHISEGAGVARRVRWGARPKARATVNVIVLTLLQGLSATHAQSSNVEARAGAKATQGKSAWTVPALVEVARITDVAIQGDTRLVAYILRSPSIFDGRDHFELYEMTAGAQDAPRKLLDAFYVSDLSWRPGTPTWTVRADLGQGVQLYQIAEGGKVRLLLGSEEAPTIGGYDGLYLGTTEEPRATGILSYQWARDGRSYWYSKVRLRSDVEQRKLLDAGVVYRDDAMYGATRGDIDRAVALLGTELRLVKVTEGADRLLAFQPSDTGGDFDVFRASGGETSWVDDRHIQYRIRATVDGVLQHTLWRLDVVGGRSTPFAPLPCSEVCYSSPTSEGFLAVEDRGSRRHLVNVGVKGSVVREYGEVPFLRLGGNLRVWKSPDGAKMVLLGEWEDHDGLAYFQKMRPMQRLMETGAHMGPCAFTDDLTFGVCSRETVADPPELIGIDLASGKSLVLARPNAASREIPPLQVTRAQWKNKFGSASFGYITWPRNYVAGSTYPALVITHGWDAKNRFAFEGFQWEFPIQVFAEHGYIVASANEPEYDPSVPRPYGAGASSALLEREQFAEGYNPAATMEAVAMDLVEHGIADPSRIGIGGYSRGGAMTRFVMSHSVVFAVGSSGENAMWDAGGFWQGNRLIRNAYRNMFGGSPFEADAYQRYLQFSPSARSEHFAGPLLQQFTGTTARNAVELDQLLKDAAVPTELVIYSGESHIFWNPRHRASAMSQNLDWFDYWLLSDVKADPAKREQYARWAEMGSKWQRSRKSAAR